MPNTQLLILLSFFPAIVGLAMQFLHVQTPAERLLALALLLFCPELSRMAWIDLEMLSAVSEQQEDSRLVQLYKIVFSTIVLELLGFYVALSSLVWGARVVLFSQLWFNLLAKIQLYPQKTTSIVAFGIAERLPVLIANTVGVTLLAFWSMAEIRVWLALGVMFLVVIFLLIKYVVLPTVSADVDA